MELGFVESLRRRWEVLGLDIVADDVQGGADDAMVEDVDADSGEEARKEVLQGALAKAVISNAVKGKNNSRVWSKVIELS